MGLHARVDAVVSAHREFAADQGAACVNRAPQRVAVECGAPAVGLASHHGGVAFIVFDQVLGDVVATHYQDL